MFFARDDVSPWIARALAEVKVGFRSKLTAHRGKLLSDRDRGTPVHAATFLRRRQIVLDRELKSDAGELRRILVHELAHFVWWRLGNRQRLSYELLLTRELDLGLPGELGWSAEWRKLALKPRDRERRTRRWREYCCESFCDTAAWLYSGTGHHPEFTLPARYRKERRKGLEAIIEKKERSCL
ncbi:MAG: hypothetical protein ACR2I2_05875 [Bryobacteraceae bacterium]